MADPARARLQMIWLRFWIPRIAALSLAILVLYGCGGVSDIADEGSSDEYLSFARSRLQHHDPLTRASALSVLMAGGESIEHLRRALDDPSLLVRNTALYLLRDTATREDVARASELVFNDAAESIGDPFARHLYEHAALDLLLNRGGAADRRRAITQIERMLREPESEAEWILAAIQVGRHRLASLEPVLRQTAEHPGQKVDAAAALAILGDEDSKKLLMQSITDRRYKGLILRNPELIETLDLSVEQIEGLDEPNDPDVHVMVATELARRGDRRRLRVLAEVLREDDIARRSEAERLLVWGVLGSVGDYGDESFVPLVEQFYQKVSNDDMKLSAAEVILRIRQRVKSEQLSRRNSGA